MKLLNKNARILCSNSCLTQRAGLLEPTVNFSLAARKFMFNFSFSSSYNAQRSTSVFRYRSYDTFTCWKSGLEFLCPSCPPTWQLGTVSTQLQIMSDHWQSHIQNLQLISGKISLKTEEDNEKFQKKTKAVSQSLSWWSDQISPTYL